MPYLFGFGSDYPRTPVFGEFPEGMVDKGERLAFLEQDFQHLRRRQIEDAEAGNDPHGLVTFPTGLFGSWR